jgi:acetyl-CoA C-acetyltransferase
MGAAQFDAVALAKYPRGQPTSSTSTRRATRRASSTARRWCWWGRRQAGAASRAECRARASVAAALVGTEPTIMLTGPGPASQKALKLAGMRIADIDLIEVNEAFAAVVLRFLRDMSGWTDTEKGQRQRRRDRAGPPAGRDGSDAAGHGARRTGAHATGARR